MSQIAHPKRLNYPFKTLVGMLCCTGSASVMADIGTAKNWLVNTVPNSQVANPLQTTQEMATSLNHLKANVSLNQAIATVDNETSTEGLVRLILIAKANNTDLPTAWQTLINNQNDDGGFGHIEGWQSNSLDTAYVLIALNESHYVDGLDAAGKADWQNRINQALAYLASQQQSNGSYQITYLDDLYINSYILSAYTPYLKQYGQYVPTVQKIVTYLQSKQTSAGTWSARGNNTGLFIDALVAESLYPYQNSDTATAFKTAFTNRALALQNADGNWQQDAYVTAVVLRALDDLAKTTTNPITSGVSATILDAETGLPLTNVVVQTGTTTATSDAQGNVSLTNLAAGSYQLSITREGYTTVNVSVTLKQGEQLNLGQIKLSRVAAASNGQIQGTIVDKTTGNAVANAVVTVVLVDATGKALPNFTPIVTTTNAQGQYQIVLTAAQQAASAGNFGINVSGAGYSAVAGSGVAQAGAVTMFSPSLTNPASATSAVSAKVVDEKGQPLANVSVMEAGQLLGVADAQGLITIAQVGQGSHQWQFSVARHQTSIVSLTVNGSTSTNLGIITLATLQLSDPSNPNSQPLPPVQGNFIVTPVDSSTNKPIDGFTVTAEQLDSNNQVIQTQSFTPSSNQTANATLPAGKWRLTVSQDAYQSASQVFDLADKQTLSYQPKLSLSPYAISGNVVDSISNQPISNAPFSIADNSTNTVIFTGTTDSQGNFTTPSNLTAANASITINPATYLPTTRLISRSYEKDPTVALGQIRLRPKSADIVLPDLYIDKLITDKKVTDSQTLLMSGELGVVVGNKGNTGMVDKPTKILAFVDANHDHKYEAGEQIIGSTTVNLTLAQSEQTTVSLPVSGKLNFKDAPIAVMVDSDGQVAESNENNNVMSTSDEVQIKPTTGTLDAEVVWHWMPDANTPYPSYFRVLTAPFVSPLIDTNGDGKIDINDDNYVIFNTFSGTGQFNSLGYTGILRAVNAKTGKELWSTGYNEGLGPHATPAIADIDGDGKPEIVIRSANSIIVYDNQGKLKWKKAVLPFSWSTGLKEWSALALYDFDGDGKAEIFDGATVVDSQGNTLMNFSTGSNSYDISIAARLYDDNKGYIIASDGIYDPLANKKIHDFPFQDGFSAIADFNKDGKPEIVSVYGNNDVYGSYPRNPKFVIMDNTGKVLVGPVNIPNGIIHGGAPVIADFDGDGIPDIGIAGTRAFSAFRADGSLIWSQETYEQSPDSTGASVFDFNNDGKAEVVYADENFLRIFDGATGNIITKIPNRSITLSEYPVIADADKDGHADILLAASGDTPQDAGVRMISSKNKDWANTRSIWNEHSYHVTNINDDLTVPAHETNSWQAHNTYRTNLLLNQDPTAASDFTTSYLRVIDKGANGSQFIARIGNAGGKTVAAGTPVSFYQKDSTGQSKLLGVIKLPKDLASDEYSDLSLDYTAPTGSLNGFGELVVIANDAGAGVDSATGIPNPTDPNAPVSSQGVIQEYTRSNNLASIAVTGDFSTFSLAANLDKTNYTANQTVTITSIPANLGSFATKPTLKVTILDSAGNVVNQYPDQQVSLGVAPIGVPLGNPPENSSTVQNFWNITNQRVGNYTAHVELINNNQTVASVDKPFAIVADGVTAAQVQSQLMVDKTQYTTTDLIQLQSRLINSASNAMATARTVTLLVKDSTGNQIWTQSYSYAELPPNALKDQYFTVPLKNVPAGQYTVTSITTANDGSQTPQTLTKNVEVVSAMHTGANISGTLQNAASIEVGSTLPLNWGMRNNNAQDITSIPASIALYRGDSATPFTTLTLPAVNISANGSISGIQNWIAQGSDGDTITAVLMGTFGNAQKTLAISHFSLTEQKVQVSLPTQSQSDTLLVYYACQDGWSNGLNNLGAEKFNYPCFNERDTILRSYLDRIAVNYKLVKTPWDFRNELESGVYGQYWLLGDLDTLSTPTYNEVIALTHAGNNILFDSGIQKWLNPDLYNLLGVKYQGRLLLETGEINPSSIYFPVPSDPQIANTTVINQTPMQGRPADSNWAIILAPQNDSVQTYATFKANSNQNASNNTGNHPYQTYPAITANRYGNGMPITTAFDMASSLDFARKTALPPYKNNANTMQLHWDSILEQLLHSRTIKPRSEYVPNEPVKIPINFTNAGSNSQRIQVDVKLPTGSTWLGYQGGVNTTASTDLIQHYQLTLQPNQSLQDVLALRLPIASGTYAIQITVNSIDQANQLHVISQQEARFLVRDITSRLTFIKQTLDPWQAKGVDGVNLKNAKTSLSLIQTYITNGSNDLAVNEAGNFSQLLANITSTTSQNTVGLRYEADELLRALQIKWYLARNGQPPLP